jgi:hypothetical protein
MPITHVHYHKAPSHSIGAQTCGAQDPVLSCVATSQTDAEGNPLYKCDHGTTTPKPKPKPKPGTKKGWW